MHKIRKHLNRIKNLFLILVLATGQVATATGPFINNLQKAAASPTKITAKDHEGQKSDLSYTSGNITQYTEGDYIDFRFDLEATHGPTNGVVEVRFTGDDGDCTFFDGSFSLGSVTTTGPVPQVTTVGVPVPADFGTSGGEWVQALNVNYPTTFDHTANEATVNYTLRLSDEAGECNGSSQHSRLSPSGGTLAQTGAQNVPVPANQIIELPEIFVEKWVDTTGDGVVDRRATIGEWSFSLDGGAAVPTDANGKVTFTNVTPDGSHTVTEQSGPAGQAFLGGSSPDQSCTFNASGVATATVASGTTSEDATCIFNNGIQQGTITLIKNVINDHGGTAGVNDFGLSTGGTSVTSGQSLTLTAGSYAIDEAGLAGYGFVNITGTGCPTLLGDDVTLAPGQNITCTITNDDIAPLLTVIKHVVNDGGGDAVAGDFTMNVTATEPSDDSFPGEESPGTTITLDAGSYSVDENAVTGYEKTIGANCSGTIAIGEHKFCTITNDDIAPILQLLKQVINDNGGSSSAVDWTLTAQSGSDTPIIDEQGTSSDGGETALTDTAEATAGLSYTLSELGPAGYTAGTWSCDGGILDGNDLTLALAEVVICTITNDDDAPSLTLVKLVTNDNGGQSVASEWTLTATGPTGFSGPGPSVSNGASFDAGTYDLSESGPAGYTASDWVCVGGTQDDGDTITLELGQNATCTITNNDNAPTLHLRKVVTNDNGGTATLADFTLTANGTGSNDISGTSPVDSGATLAADTFVLSETGPAGYTSSGWVCVGGTQNGANITLGLGQEATCTITNDDIAPNLTLNKIVSNTHGGDAIESDWTITATGPTPLSGAGAAGSEDVVSGSDFSAGTYTLSESAGPAGYSPSAWTCTNNVTVTNNQITLANGQTTVCTITNSDIAPTLTVTKVVLNPFGNPLLASAFPLFVDSTSVTSGVSTTQFDAGSHTISETQQTGYEFTGIDGDCTLDDDIISIVLGLAGSYTCTITNTAIQPKLIVIKHVINDNGGDKDAEDFTMTVGGNSVTVPNFDGEESPGTTVLLNEGSYSVDELTDAGYTKTLGNDCSGTIAIGETKTCTITNDDIAPVLTLTKEVVSNNETRQASDWTLTATPTEGAAITGNGEDGVDEEAAVAHVTYTLSEVNNADGTFDASEWDCTSSAGTFSNGEEGLNNQIRMSEGANVTCTITNTERGSITIIKDAQPDSSQEFKFTGSLGDPDDEEGPNFTLVDDGQNDVTDRRTFTELQEGTYTVTEPNVKGWTLEGITCVGGNDAKENERNAVIKLEPGENVTCTFVNTRDTGEITVTKITNPSPDVDEEDFTIRLRDDTESNDIIHESILSDGQSDTYQVETNDYTMNEEVIPSGWDLADAYCTRDEGESTFDPRKGFTLEKDDDVACFFLNEKRAEVKVTKYNDYNRNGQYDPDETELAEPTLPGWEFNLNGAQNCEEYDLFQILDNFLVQDLCQDYSYDKTQTTGDDGTTTFTGVRPGIGHELSETLQDDWQLSNIHCNGDERGVFEEDEYYVYASPGETVECFVGNFQDTVLLIEKSNNRPNPTTVGDTVTYTLTVTVPENSGPSYNTTVTDLPPEGFNYVPGSWTANSSVRGNLVPGTTTEPTYASPGVWQLGNMLPGEVVTLTYQALIASTVSAGTYPDVAFALGCETPDDEECEVLSNVSAGADTPFVATNVTIKGPQVLAATILVNTGTADIWHTIMAATLLMGLALATSVRRQKKGAAL